MPLPPVTVSLLMVELKMNGSVVGTLAKTDSLTPKFFAKTERGV